MTEKTDKIVKGRISPISEIAAASTGEYFIKDNRYTKLIVPEPTPVGIKLASAMPAEII